MAFHEIKGFRGVNLRRDRLSLQDDELARAINADLFSFIGAIRPRRGRRAAFNVNSLIEDLNIRHMEKSGGYRYQVAGRSLYRDQVKILNGLFSGNLITSAMVARPLTDPTTWVFFADDALMRKDDGTNLYRWGLPAPRNAPTIEKGPNGSLTGAYSGRYTKIRFVGDSVAHESNPSPLSKALHFGGVTSLVFSEIPNPSPTINGVNGFGFYRSLNDGTDHLLVERVKIPTTGAVAISHGWEASFVVGLAHHWTLPGSTPKTPDDDDKSTPTGSGTGARTPMAFINRSPAEFSSSINPAANTLVWSIDRATGGGEAASQTPALTKYFTFQNFGFNFTNEPAAIITGIEVKVVRSRGNSSPGEVVDYRVRIIQDGTIGSTDRADTTTRWPVNKTEQRYGNSNDLWGLTWTQGQIASADFGFAISAQIDNNVDWFHATIHLVTITVYLSNGSAATVSSFARLTQQWEPGLGPAKSGVANYHMGVPVIPGEPIRAAYGSAISAVSSEDANGYRATHPWEISDYVTTQTRYWAYASSALDSSLGTPVELNNDGPPLASWAVYHNETAFLCRDSLNPHYLWFSKRFRPESWPVDNFIEIGSPLHPLQCAISYAGILGVFSGRTKYRVSGSDTSGYVAQEAISHRGTRSPHAVVATEKGILFPSRDGVFLTNFFTEDEPIAGEILPLFYGETVNDYAPINWDAAKNICAAYFKKRFFLAYPSGVSTWPDMVAVYSIETQKWYFYDFPALSFLREEETDYLLTGSNDGFVYYLEQGADESVTMTFESKDFAPESANLKKLFRFFKVDADCDGETLTAEFMIDGQIKGTARITGNRTHELERFVAGAMGHSWRIRLTYTGKKRPTIYGAAVEYLPLSAA